MEMRGQIHSQAALPSGETTPSKHWIGDWLDLRAGLDVTAKRKFLESNLGRLAPNLVTIMTDLSWLQGFVAQELQALRLG